MPPSQVTLHVPATTSNLSAGFDCLGIALSLSNEVTLKRTTQETVLANSLPSMAQEAAALFFQKTNLTPFLFETHIRNEVPISRGLGSSVTIRLAILAGLNVLVDSPLTSEELLHLLIEMEGHPDNAAPAFFGGFTVCAGEEFLTTEVDPDLHFVALIPDFTISTPQARKSLPTQVPFAHAVSNLQYTARITAAFFQKKYTALAGAFCDHLHQVYRAKNLPGTFDIIRSAEKAGALGGFISGSGSTLIALTLDSPQAIQIAMLEAAQQSGLTAETKVLRADNQGMRIDHVH